ncbi:hypothetical protein J2Y41_003902 [Arthrobacter sp. 1088]|nr:hypothetical protein [Arthrobacter sp. 1088]
MTQRMPLPGGIDVRQQVPGLRKASLEEASDKQVGNSRGADGQRGPGSTLPVPPINPSPTVVRILRDFGERATWSGAAV